MARKLNKMHDSLKNYSQDSVEAAEEILLSMGIKKNPTNTGELAAIIDTHFKSLSQRAEQAKARVQELETEDDNALEAYKLLQADTAALRAANAELAGALQAVLANRHQLEGEAMFLVLPECEEHARALLARQQTK